MTTGLISGEAEKGVDKGGRQGCQDGNWQWRPGKGTQRGYEMRLCFTDITTGTFKSDI